MTAVLLEVGVIVALVLVNGFFAMSEIAIVSAQRARVRAKVEQGKSRYRLVLKTLDAPGSFLSTIQAGITLIGILAGAFGGATLATALDGRLEAIPALAPYSESLAIGAVVLCTTYLSVVIGELVPKRMALADPESVAAAIIVPVRVFSILLMPLARLFAVSTDGILALFGLNRATRPAVTSEDVKSMIREGTESGIFAAQERDMVEAVLKLAGRRVSAFMKPRTILPLLDTQWDSPRVRQVLVRCSEHPYVPVCRGGLDNVVGVVHTSEALAAFAGGSFKSLSDFVHKAILVPESLDALQATLLFRTTAARIAFVVDEYGGIEGTVSAIDLAEGILGAITTADKGVQAGIRRISDGSIVVEGLYPFERLLEDLQLSGSQGSEDFHTVGGFVLQQLGRIPVVGDQFRWQGRAFQVVAVERNRVARISIGPPEDAGPGDQGAGQIPSGPAGPA